MKHTTFEKWMHNRETLHEILKDDRRREVLFKVLRAISSENKEEVRGIREEDLDRDILMLIIPGRSNSMVVNYLVERGYQFSNPEFLKIVLDKRNDMTVAHYMAAFNRAFFDPGIYGEILRLRQADDGWTVAHYMARHGHVIDPVKHRDLLLLEDNRGQTVLSVLFGWNAFDITIGRLDHQFFKLSSDLIRVYIDEVKNLSVPEKDKVLARLEKLYSAKVLQEKAFEEVSSTGIIL